MNLTITDAIRDVRIVLDDILKDSDNDFEADKDTEIEAALKRACRELLMEVPAEYLQPTVIRDVEGSTDPTPSQVKNTDGTGYVVLPSDYMRLVSFKLWSWAGVVRETIDPLSDEARQQVSRWTRGTPQKPKAMADVDQNGNKVLRYWTAGMYNSPTASALDSVYNHKIEYLSYVAEPVVVNATAEPSPTEKTITVALKENMRDKIIYRAAGLFLVGKKELDLAKVYFNLSQVLSQVPSQGEGV
jgi:hypothetical protein